MDGPGKPSETIQTECLVHKLIRIRGIFFHLRPSLIGTANSDKQVVLFIPPAEHVWVFGCEPSSVLKTLIVMFDILTSSVL